MKRIMLLLTVALVMAVMMLTIAMPAFAARPDDANRLRACDAPGPSQGHGHPQFCI
jgi:hypothetical protein